jgi:hypothetical protein
MNADWLYMRGKRVAGRVVKVRAGLEVYQRMHKATGGLIRSEFAVEDARYKDVSISGDFFCFPKDAVDRLANSLEDYQTGKVSDAIAEIYHSNEINIPGVTPDDWLQLFRI